MYSLIKCMVNHFNMKELVAFNSSHLTFWEKRSIDTESRRNVSKLVFKLIGDLDPGSSPG